MKDLQIGDEVLAVPHGDPDAEATVCRITEINRSSAESSWQLIFENQNGEPLELNVLAGHPIYVEGRGWTDIADLKTGDVCVSSDGTLLPLRSKTLIDQPVNAWSITVEGNHTFYVGQETGEMLLAHNGEPKNIFRLRFDDPKRRSCLEGCGEYYVTPIELSGPRISFRGGWSIWDKF